MQYDLANLVLELGVIKVLGIVECHLQAINKKRLEYSWIQDIDAVAKWSQ